MKRLFVILGSVWLYQVVSTTLLVRFIAPALLPQLGLLWVAYLAEEPSPVAARANEVFIRNLIYAAVIGYFDGRTALAPHGLHMAVYCSAYVLQRFLGSEQGQNRAATFLTTALSVGGVSVLLWWLKGLLVRFASITPFQPWDIVIDAGIAGALAVLTFKTVARWLQGADTGYGRRLS